ncbi:hypothetical protein Pmani_004429 [Petrolisthes manimaculis]|uniref:Uncharacterized protein n=1 Tax=Petrolisthes manimaculis TaxID=1843537 RepID=A0AAE1QEQ5_9EUCA|nr:hypothetical protein Pmani_004429 [Petrolisthes manimaculis]
MTSWVGAERGLDWLSRVQEGRIGWVWARRVSEWLGGGQARQLAPRLTPSLYLPHSTSLTLPPSPHIVHSHSASPRLVHRLTLTRRGFGCLYELQSY